MKKNRFAAMLSLYELSLSLSLSLSPSLYVSVLKVFWTWGSRYQKGLRSGFDWS